GPAPSRPDDGRDARHGGYTVRECRNGYAAWGCRDGNARTTSGCQRAASIPVDKRGLRVESARESGGADRFHRHWADRVPHGVHAALRAVGVDAGTGPDWLAVAGEESRRAAVDAALGVAGAGCRKSLSKACRTEKA